MKIQIDINAADFEQLWSNSMEWQGQDWEKQSDRFDPLPSFTKKYAYWFEDYVSLKIAEAFVSLTSGYSIHSDEATASWVLLTDYESPCYIKVKVNA